MIRVSDSYQDMVLTGNRDQKTTTFLREFYKEHQRK